jgi:hypothetical protein
MGGEDGSLHLGSHFPHGHQDLAQQLSLPLGMDGCPHPFLDELEALFVFGDLERHLFCGTKPPYLLGFYPARTWCVLCGTHGAGCASLALFLVTSWPLLSSWW